MNIVRDEINSWLRYIQEPYRIRYLYKFPNRHSINEILQTPALWLIVQCRIESATQTFCVCCWKAPLPRYWEHWSVFTFCLTWHSAQRQSESLLGPDRTRFKSELPATGNCALFHALLQSADIYRARGLDQSVRTSFNQSCLGNACKWTSKTVRRRCGFAAAC